MEREKNFHTFFDTIDDLLFVRDAEGRIQHLNRAVTQRLGYAETALIGRLGGWRANPISNTLMWAEGLYAILGMPLDYRPDAARRQMPFDLVLLDWKMPDMNGLKVARRIHASARDGLLPLRLPLLVMVTAYGRENLLRDAGKLRIDAILDKPVLPSTLHVYALAHTLKAEAGNLGLSPAQAAADALAQALQQDQKMVMLQVDALRIAFDQALVLLDQVHATPKPVIPITATSAVDLEQLQERLQKLAPLLDHGKLKARRLVEDLDTLLAGSTLAPAFKPVSDAMQHLDFDHALEHLRRFAAAYDWSLP